MDLSLIFVNFSKNIKSNKFKVTNQSFKINHFAESVEYTTERFLEKNHNSVFEDQLNFIKKSKV